MLLICLLACQSAPLALPPLVPVEPARSEAAIRIEQPAGDAQLTIEAVSNDASVVVERAADAQGLAVSIVTPLQRQSATTRALVYRAPVGAVRLGQARLTSGFGLRHHPILGGVRFHQGVDLAAPFGAPIFSADAGVVSMAGWHRGYGLLVALNHARGMQSRYGHMSRLLPTKAMRLPSGEKAARPPKGVSMVACSREGVPSAGLSCARAGAAMPSVAPMTIALIRLMP